MYVVITLYEKQTLVIEYSSQTYSVHYEFCVRVKHKPSQLGLKLFPQVVHKCATILNEPTVRCQSRK